MDMLHSVLGKITPRHTRLIADHDYFKCRSVKPGNRRRRALDEPQPSELGKIAQLLVNRTITVEKYSPVKASHGRGLEWLSRSLSPGLLDKSLGTLVEGAMAASLDVMNIEHLR